MTSHTGIYSKQVHPEKPLYPARPQDPDLGNKKQWRKAKENLFLHKGGRRAHNGARFLTPTPYIQVMNWSSVYQAWDRRIMILHAVQIDDRLTSPWFIIRDHFVRVWHPDIKVVKRRELSPWAARPESKLRREIKALAEEGMDTRAIAVQYNMVWPLVEMLAAGEEPPTGQLDLKKLV